VLGAEGHEARAGADTAEGNDASEGVDRETETERALNPHSDGVAILCKERVLGEDEKGIKVVFHASQPR
jgi:hypothetical protein